ncbi:MAG: hypothetical protein ACI89M_000872, partial [Chitinophagales bacterium]
SSQAISRSSFLQEEKRTRARHNKLIMGEAFIGYN